ncbi:hypothetical protein ACNQFZ_04360 [Schinkia sp. CFF1]
MALLVYLFIGFVISTIFIFVPAVEMKSIGYFFIILITWLPLFLFGLIFITFYDFKELIF